MCNKIPEIITPNMEYPKQIDEINKAREKWLAERVEHPEFIIINRRFMNVSEDQTLFGMSIISVYFLCDNKGKDIPFVLGGHRYVKLGERF